MAHHKFTYAIGLYDASDNHVMQHSVWNCLDNVKCLCAAIQYNQRLMSTWYQQATLKLLYLAEWMWPQTHSLGDFSSRCTACQTIEQKF